MCDAGTMRNTWEKVLEYASMPEHGTICRKLRKGVKIQINNDPVIDNAQISISECYVRFTQGAKGKEVITSYYDLSKIESIKTFSSGKE